MLRGLRALLDTERPRAPPAGSREARPAAASSKLRAEGHFIGTAFFMQSLGGADLSLEGDEMIFLDGEQVASIRGTGTEDYFSGGFHFDRGAYSAPYHGAPLTDDAL